MNKKKAFTLTELLVVVVIIGVLSAVVLPKFTKVLETRKTSEAENVMAAVRSEQEARCMLGKDYTGDATKLASLPSGSSKHFNYTLNAQGITATAASGKYELKIPSYTDGRICCSSGCDELNKNYPSCDKLDLEQATCSVPPDEKPNPPCVGPSCEEPDGDEGCEPGTTETDYSGCTCGPRSRTCQGDRTWGEWSECAPKPDDLTCKKCNATVSAKCDPEKGWLEPSEDDCPQTCDCGEKPADKQPETQKCTPEGYEEECGEQKREVKCDEDTNYEWEYPDWKDVTCEPTDACEDDDVTTCGDWMDEADDNLAIDGLCDSKGLSISEEMFDKKISKKMSRAQVIAACCSGCPEGTEYRDGFGICCPRGQAAVYNSKTGETVCGSCSQLVGPNYYFDGSGCSRRFTMQATTFPVVLGQVYQNFVPSGDACSFNFQGSTVGACALQGNKRTGFTSVPPGDLAADNDPCDACSADSVSCDAVACYDSIALDEIKAKVKKATVYDYNISVSGKNGGWCEGSVWYDKDGWRELVGVNTGDAQLCGISQNGVWLSDLGIDTAYCSSCGGKSATVPLHNATQMPSQQGGRCQEFYTTGDYTQTYGVFDYLNEEALHRYVNDPSWTSGVSWNEIEDVLQERAAEQYEWVRQRYQESALEKGLTATNGRLLTLSGNDPDMAWNTMGAIDWQSMYPDPADFARAFGVDPAPQEGAIGPNGEVLTEWGANYNQWYLMQTLYYKNNIPYDASAAIGASSNTQVVYQNQNYDDDYAWKQYLEWMKKRTQDTKERLRNGAHCPDTITACAAPIIYEVKGYSCRRK